MDMLAFSFFLPAASALKPRFIKTRYSLEYYKFFKLRHRLELKLCTSFSPKMDGCLELVFV